MLAILGLILKFLPYLVPLLKGFFGALGNLQVAENKEGTAVIDPEALQKFIEEQTTKVIKETIEKHKGELVAYVPTEDEKKREEALDALAKELEKAQQEYEKEREAKKKEKETSNPPGTQHPEP